MDSILELLTKEGFATHSNPDVYARAYAHFGVEEARELRERANLAAVHGRRVFIVATPVMTTEAQNALLKTLEDAPGDALFFIIVPNPGALLSTVRSRSQILLVDSGERSSVDEKKFLAAAHEKRMEMLKGLLERGEEDRRDIASIMSFLSGLEREMGRKTPSQRGALHAIYRAKKYLGDKGALVKPLLEQVALLLPVMKA